MRDIAIYPLISICADDNTNLEQFYYGEEQKMGGIAFFFVGAVLFVTALMMMGKAEAKSVGVFHGLLGILLLSMVFKLFFVAPHDFFTAQSCFFLFSLIFLYVHHSLLAWIAGQ